MGDPAGQGSHRLHFLGVEELAVEALPFGLGGPDFPGHFVEGLLDFAPFVGPVEMDSRRQIAAGNGPEAGRQSLHWPADVSQEENIKEGDEGDDHHRGDGKDEPP